MSNAQQRPLNRQRRSRPSLKITRCSDTTQPSTFLFETWSPFTGSYRTADSIENGLRRVRELADLINQMWLQSIRSVTCWQMYQAAIRTTAHASVTFDGQSCASMQLSTAAMTRGGSTGLAGRGRPVLNRQLPPSVAWSAIRPATSMCRQTGSLSRAWRGRTPMPSRSLARWKQERHPLGCQPKRHKSCG